MFSEMEQLITRSVLRSQQSSVTEEIDFSFPFRRGVGSIYLCWNIPFNFQRLHVLTYVSGGTVKKQKKKKVKTFEYLIFYLM